MSLPGELNFSRRQRLPLVLASEAAECGLACIVMIARFHGHDVDLNGLRQRFSLSMSGISLRNLMGLADQLGFSTRPLRVDLGAPADRVPCGAVGLDHGVSWVGQVSPSRRSISRAFVSLSSRNCPTGPWSISSTRACSTFSGALVLTWYRDAASALASS